MIIVRNVINENMKKLIKDELANVIKKFTMQINKSLNSLN